MEGAAPSAPVARGEPNAPQGVISRRGQTHHDPALSRDARPHGVDGATPSTREPFGYPVVGVGLAWHRRAVKCEGRRVKFEIKRSCGFSRIRVPFAFRVFQR